MRICRGYLMRVVLLHPPSTRWKSTTLGLDIQEEFDGIQLNFRFTSLGVEAGRDWR